jgi:hypothetical protein
MSFAIEAHVPWFEIRQGDTGPDVAFKQAQAEKIIGYEIQNMNHQLGRAVWNLLETNPGRFFVLSYSGVEREKDYMNLLRAITLRASVYAEETMGSRPMWREPLPPISFDPPPPTLGQRLRMWWNRGMGVRGDNILQRSEVNRMAPCCIKQEDLG